MRGDLRRRGGRAGIHRAAAVLAAAALAAVTAPPAAAWTIDPGADREDLTALHRALAASVYFTPGHGAKPLGLVGWELHAGLAAAPDADGDPAVERALDGRLSGGALGVGRIGLRKGLPGRFDLGLAYGRTVGGDVDLVSGELQWALVDGGAVTPAVGFRLTATEATAGGAYDLRQFGLEALVSKGFTVLTPYAGAGVARSESRFHSAARTVAIDTTDEFLYAGLTLNLLLPKLTIELRQGDELTGAVRLAFGF